MLVTVTRSVVHVTWADAQTGKNTHQDASSSVSVYQVVISTVLFWDGSFGKTVAEGVG